MALKRTQLCLLVPLKELSVLAPFLCSVFLFGKVQNEDADIRLQGERAARQVARQVLLRKHAQGKQLCIKCRYAGGRRTQLFITVLKKAAFNKRSRPADLMLILKIFDEP